MSSKTCILSRSILFMIAMLFNQGLIRTLISFTTSDISEYFVDFANPDFYNTFDNTFKFKNFILHLSTLLGLGYFSKDQVWGWGGVFELAQRKHCF